MDSSLNLNTLANSLPNSNIAIAEKDLLNNFKGNALVFLCRWSFRAVPLLPLAILLMFC
jgi:hypothetical protein